jgi:hypothetical protein
VQKIGIEEPMCFEAIPRSRIILDVMNKTIRVFFVKINYAYIYGRITNKIQLVKISFFLIVIQSHIGIFILIYNFG